MRIGSCKEEKQGISSNTLCNGMLLEEWVVMSSLLCQICFVLDHKICLKIKNNRQGRFTPANIGEARLTLGVRRLTHGLSKMLTS